MSDNSEKIIITGVSKIIKQKNILNDINLQLEKGLVHCFFGENGSGKTMLLRAIAGLITVDMGFINVFGQQITTDHSFPKDMGLLIENITFWKGFDCIQILETIAKIKNVATKEDIIHALERVGLDPANKKKYRTYSLGMRQKLALAQAIMEKPKLLILDEPTNGLDSASVELFRNIIAEEKARGTTILLSTHNKEDVLDLCDKVYFMKDGKCRECSPEEWK